jgi:hypothetical protein
VRAQPCAMLLELQTMTAAAVPAAACALRCCLLHCKPCLRVLQP